MFIPMFVFRIIILVVLATAFGWYTFRRTPELDKVKNKWLYRFTFWMSLVRVMLFVLFRMLNLFPLPE